MKHFGRGTSASTNLYLYHGKRYNDSHKFNHVSLTCTTRLKEKQSICVNNGHSYNFVCICAEDTCAHDCGQGACVFGAVRRQQCVCYLNLRMPRLSFPIKTEQIFSISLSRISFGLNSL